MDYCWACANMGKPSGCLCGRYVEIPIVIDRVVYGFVENTERGSGLHKDYQALKDGGARVAIREAIDQFHHPLPDHVAIWLAVEDRKIAEEAGLFVFGAG